MGCQERGPALNTVPAGRAPPLAGVQVPVHFSGAERGEGNGGTGQRHVQAAVRGGHRNAGQDVMDGAGKPRRRTAADYMASHVDQTVELTNPHYVLFRAEGEPWHVQAKTGQVSPDGTVVRLLGKVDVWRSDPSGARDLDVRTEHLVVLPDSEYGETGEPVTIRTPASTSTGVGMRAFLDETRFELLSQVRTHVDRHRPQL